jgi:fatty acid desaturase
MEPSEDRTDPGPAPEASEPTARQPRNPFRNEQDAFYLLIVVGVAVIAVALVSSQISVVLGAVLGAVLLALGIRASLRWIGAAVGARKGRDEDPYGKPEER